jgi:hypothetical protein
MSKPSDCLTCEHPAAHHDAGECWTTERGHNTWGKTSCDCGWYEPIGSAATEVEASTVSARDLLGIAPVWTGGMSSVDWVREQRVRHDHR